MTTPQCGTQGCERLAHCRGLCPMHYQRLRLRGEVGSAAPEKVMHPESSCEVESCETRSKYTTTAGRICPMHYRRLKSTGRLDLRALPAYGPADPRPCSVCGITKPSAEFYDAGVDRKAGRCKPCDRTAMNTRYRDRKAGNLPTEHVEEQECGDCREVKPRSAYGIDHARRTGLKRYCKPCSEVRWRRSKYRLTSAEHDGLMATASAGCRICGSLIEKLVVDHCHSTGSVRGLLCDDCNVGLGRFRDDPDRLLAAATYLLATSDVLAAL